MKIQHFEDVGIKSLHDLTKEELIFCIEGAIGRDKSAKFWFDRRLLDIADKRREKRLKEIEAKGDLCVNLLKEYEELIKPYHGKKLSEWPPAVIEKGVSLEKKIKKTQEEYFATLS